MPEHDSGQPEPHEASLIALLSCRELVVEHDFSLTLFRVVERVNIRINVTPGTMPAWSPIPIHFFLAISCFGIHEEHEHLVEMRMYYPNGNLLGNTEVTPVLIGGKSALSYRDFEIQIPQHHAGNYTYEAWIDGKLLGKNIFTVTHETVTTQSPPSEDARTSATKNV